MHPNDETSRQQTPPAASPSYLIRLFHALRASWRIWLIGLIVVGGATTLFLSLADEVLERDSFRWDAPLMLAVHRLSTPWLDQLLIAITWIGHPGEYLITAICVIWLWRQRLPAASVALVVCMVGAGLLNIWLKLLFARPRPSIFPPVIIDTSYSFPSGHTMGAVALYGFLAYLLWQHKRRVWAVVALLFALLIAFSRIYLGVHYPSDILGALAISVLWLAMVIAGYSYYQRRYGRNAETALPSSPIQGS
ncbi:MAG TPA: phosphatase PAP2 family protein [Caldilineaceae bacterium]|nr:phosphatase PAP2 family protein [Caldilineaceae bacterium]